MGADVQHVYLLIRTSNRPPGDLMRKVCVSWEAVRQYREFIEDGFNMGRREDLTGGGLGRSAGGWEGVLGGIGPVFRYIPALSLASHQAR